MKRTQPNRRGASSGKRRRSAKPRSPTPHRRHPLFGDIPLIPAQTVDDRGRIHHYLTYDLSWQPELPSGAVRGDVRKQDFCPMCHVPRYFYVDQEKQCVQCGRRFVFSAAEQKFWYESLQFHFNSVAIRCAGCRRRQRTIRALSRQVSAARKLLRSDPSNPSLLLSICEALVSYRKRTGQGNLDEAIAAARKAVRCSRNTKWGGVAEALFWEAAAHKLAGRDAKARGLFQKFLKRVGNGRRHRALVTEARSYLGLA